MMKHFFIFFLILFCTNVFSQDDYYEYVYIKVINSDHEFLKDAHVFVNGINIPFVLEQQAYYIEDTFKMPVDIEAYSEGYDTLIHSFHYLSRDNSAYLRLKRFSEKFYYAGEDWLKMPYRPHPNQLLVILNDRKFPHDDSLRIRFENKIQQKGLKIYTDFPEPPSEGIDVMLLKSFVGLEYRVIIEKEDGSDFASDYCDELTFLRSLDEVLEAGPLIRLRGYSVNTYSNKIKLVRFGANILSEQAKERSEEINQLVKQVDERFYFDENTWEIVLPPETNEIVPEIMDKLRELGVKEAMKMVMYNMKRKG